MIISLRFFQGESGFLQQNWIEENSSGKNALHPNILRRISISETLVTRIGNSFLKSENSSWQKIKKKVFLERMFNSNLMKRIAIPETPVIRIGNSFSQEREFFLTGNEEENSSVQNVQL